RAGPVVLFDGSDLVFRYGSYRRVSHPTPPLYGDLKTVSHVTLGLHSLLVASGGGPLNDRPLFVLTRYQEAIERARKAIGERGLTKAQVKRQEEILDACRALVAGAIRARKAEAKEVVAALRKLRPLLDRNTAEAARAQIDGLHREMTAYRGQLSETAWQR